MKTQLRLNHFLSSAGAVSRRKADLVIKAGKVRVNNQLILDPAYRVTPTKDEVHLNGKPQYICAEKWHIAFNKPKKTLTALSDPKGRPLVMDYFKKVRAKIFPVGRLDWDSEGLLLLTNDGDFAQEILSTKPPKTYVLKLNRVIDKARLARLKKGVRTEVGYARALYADFCRGSSKQWVKVIIAEGRNRQLHHMFTVLGLRVRVLRRTAIGQLKLRSLKTGAFFMLSYRDRQKVFRSPTELMKPHKGP